MMSTANKWMKKAILILLTVMMVFGGATSALAGGKDYGYDKKFTDNKSESKLEVKKNGNIEIKLSFKDLEKMEWAQKFIAQLAADKVFNGYEDGTFRPNQPVKRAEALVAAVRLMGLTAQADAKMNAELNFKDAELIKKKFAYAVGYIAVALENDLFAETEDKVQPESSADRLWATMLLVKAMKLEADAKAKMNVKLPFRDAKDIPAPAVGYVAVALEKGLISGYEDGTFRPHRPVTRAELAALLGRMDDQQPETPEAGGIQGLVTQAVSGNVLTLNHDGKVTSYVLDPNAFIFRQGAKVTAADLKVGDKVVAKAYNNVVIFVDVTVPAANPADPQIAFTEEGKYQYHTITNTGTMATITIAQTINNQLTVKTYPVASNVTITGDLQSLVIDRTIVLKGVNQVVSTIEIK